MEFTIRNAQPDDAELLHQLGRMTYSAHFKHMWVSEAELDEFIDKEYGLAELRSSLVAPNESWLIAETNKPIGFAKVTWNTPVPDSGMSGAQLNKLYLNPQETGKNYGRRMFESIIHAARDKQEGYLWLEVMGENVRARKFYEAFGMQHIKDIPFITASQQSILQILGMVI
ncbi:MULTISPECIES: GNAT family N-acetyltransferase [Pantoea]|jgi:ribosomal protein S18 acetylase RimI-like enzyme|uniref:Alanine acetyltransferase n=1 Tax=Pantoea dispersa TaxID=59814 RepID=A0A8E1RZN2_9GAMM|nr:MULTISPECIES: GNAT family N-acetyltransferase [Pantoea]MBK4784759.1 GNAT family N-acetyltransferase [Pantoea sp. Pent]ERH67132.1 GNAT family acetyltransferase [Pantoea dispersa EGD-AAK13]KAA6103694.1 GNAT family N-acetyltransferase [Pantoea sp. B_9]KAA6116658.1 GNAT family N-acetyltransferase [Pantoea sp. B_10]KAA8668070.1 GNAT family N-acetyltransferase [Pantoea dispersa]